MNEDLKILWDLAIKEATKLREYATQEEKDNLSLNIEPHRATKCVYGLMTGNCFSKRAMDLINACCEKVYATNNKSVYPDECELNGTPSLLSRPEYRRITYYSPIEVIIFPRWGGQKAVNQLIPYIKGETDHIEIPE